MLDTFDVTDGCVVIVAVLPFNADLISFSTALGASLALVDLNLADFPIVD